MSFLDKMISKKAMQQSDQLMCWKEKHDQQYPFPSDQVELTENIPYLNDSQPCHRMDIFRPKNHTGKLPVLFNIHGGGLLMGTKEVNRLFCAEMCQKGFLVFGLEYPLVPEKDIFSIFQDLMNGLQKAASLFDEYEGNPCHIYLTGDSAGAYLCVYLSAMLKNSALAEAAQVIPADNFNIKALGLISGMFYTRKKDDIGIFLPSYIYGKNWKKHPFRPYMDPENPEIIKNLPPAFLVTGHGDFLRHYSREFAEALKRNGAICHLEDFETSKKTSSCIQYPSPRTAREPESK